MEAIIEGFVALLRLFIWGVLFIGAAALSPPIIFIVTKLDKSKPFWPTFWRRYRSILGGAFGVGP